MGARRHTPGPARRLGPRRGPGRLVGTASTPSTAPGARARWQWRRDHPRRRIGAPRPSSSAFNDPAPTWCFAPSPPSPRSSRMPNIPACSLASRLRSPDLLLARVGWSRHDVVAVKPPCDSHLTAHLPDAAAPALGTTPAPAAAPATGTTPLPGPTPAHNAPGHNAPGPTPLNAHDGAAPAPRALWVWRRRRPSLLGGRGSGPVTATSLPGSPATVSTSPGRPGMTPEILATLRDLGPARLTPLDGAALFWWVRNTSSTQPVSTPGPTSRSRATGISSPTRPGSGTGSARPPDCPPPRRGSIRPPPAVRRPARLDLDRASGPLRRPLRAPS